MANRYWAGGTGTWGGTDTTHWSAATPITFTASCSGTNLTTTGGPALSAGMTVWSSTFVSLGTIVSGSGDSWVVSIGGTYASQTMSSATVGASIPVTTDAVFFDHAATYTVTGSGTLNCSDMTVSAGTVTFTSGTLNVSGSFSLVTGTVFNMSALIFNATTTGKTITNNGTGSTNTTFNGVGGYWTLGSAFTTTGTLTVTSGTLDTSINSYNLSGASLNSAGALTRSIILNSSNVTLSNATPITISGTGLTLSASSATFTISGNTVTVTIPAATPITFGTVNFTGTTGDVTISGGPVTYTNLNVSPPNATVGVRNVIIDSNQTITGTLTLTGGSSSRRIFLRSSVIGTTKTVSVEAFSASPADIDFRDIQITGTAAGTSITRAGDCGGNSGLTFTSKTVYWNLAGAQNWNATGWASSSGGAPSGANFPLAQDTAVFNEATNSVTGTITYNVAYPVGNIDMSSRTTAMTLALTAAPQIYGDWKNGTGTTLTGTGIISFLGRNTTQTITSNGKAFPTTLTIQSIGGSVVLADALSTTLSATTAVTLTAGTLNLNGFTLTISGASGGFTSNTTTYARTLNFGTGGSMIIGGSGTSWNTSSTNMTMSGTGTVSLISASAKTFNAAGAITTFPFTINNGGAGQLSITHISGSTYTGFSNTVQPTSFNFTSGSTYYLSNFNVNGVSGSLVTLTSSSTTAAILNKVGGGTISCDYLSVNKLTASNANWWAGANSTKGTSPVTGWLFSAPITFSTTNNNFLFLFYN